MPKVDPKMLGVAAEFAVASELGRRSIYAQPTFGHQKKTDLLIFGGNTQVFRVEVKGKQGRVWPSCKGIPNSSSFLVLVDFHGKHEDQRPDFYILEVQDWIRLVEERMTQQPREKIILTEDNVPIWTTEINHANKPRAGMNVQAADIVSHKERWDKISQALGLITHSPRA